MPKPTIEAGYLKALLDFAVSKGADRKTLIDEANIQNVGLEKKDDRVPLSKYLALLDVAIRLCNEPSLSLLFGEAVPMEDISILGSMGRLVGTVEEGRDVMNRYSRLTLDADDGGTSDPVEFIRENGDLWLKFTGEIYVEYPSLTESGIARGVCGGREILSLMPDLAGVSFPKAIRFTHPEPSYRSEYDRVFGVPLFFGSNMNALLIDEKLLSITMPRANPYLADILKAHAEKLLKNLEDSKSTVGRVESLLIPVLHTGEASVGFVARKLGLSRQTLFRKLKEEGSTFEKVLTELRHRLALHYLKTKKASVNETAYLVGFTEPAAFSRAFKRWTGFNPSSVRDPKSKI